MALFFELLCVFHVSSFLYDLYLTGNKHRELYTTVGLEGIKKMMKSGSKSFENRLKLNEVVDEYFPMSAEDTRFTRLLTPDDRMSTVSHTGIRRMCSRYGQSFKNPPADRQHDHYGLLAAVPCKRAPVHMC